MTTPKLIALFLAVFAITSHAATYFITGSGTFTATKDGTTVGTGNIQTVIDAIKTDANGADCTITFGNGTSVLNINPAAITFNGGTNGDDWGLITLAGKLTVVGSGSTANIITISNGASVTSDAELTATQGGYLLNFNSTGTLTISGGTVSTTTGYAVRNTSTGAVTISGGTVSATTGVAVSNNYGGKITVSGTAKVTSKNVTVEQGTIQNSGTVEITGGTVENTANVNYKSNIGSAIYHSASSRTVTISGGAVLAKDGYAIYKSSTGTITLTGGVVFAYGTNIYGVLTENLATSGNPAIVAWNKSANTTTYTALSTTDIFAHSPTIATWDMRNGIAYANGTNTGFIPIEGVTVNKITATTPTGLTATYGQTLANVSLPAGWSWVSANSTPVGNAGPQTHNAKYTPTDTDNYNTLSSVSVSITVNKADPAITWPTSATITYGQTLADAIFAGQSGAGTFAFTESTTSLDVAHSGTQHQVKFTPTDPANYNTLTQNMAVTVNRASGLENNSQILHQISASNANTHTYDLKTLTLNKADHGTLGYSLAGALAGSDPTILAAISLDGNGILSYKGAGKTSGTATQAITITSQNYFPTTATITFEATAKEEIAITVTEVNSYTYDGTPKSGYTGAATAPPYTGELVYEWAGTGHSQDDTPPTNAGEYTLRITLPPDAPYVGAKRIDFTIAKKQIAKPTVTNISLVYTGGEQSAGIAANAAYTITGDKGTNASSYTATVALKDKDNYEWEDGETDDILLPWAIAANTPIIPQIATGSIRVQATANAIMLENLPKNTKVQIYSLQGKQIYSNNSENSQILRIPVQTKGIYVVKAGNQTVRIAVR